MGKKGRTKEELHQIMEWLTGFDESKTQELIDQEVTFKELFVEAELNPNAHHIKVVIPNKAQNEQKVLIPLLLVELIIGIRIFTSKLLFGHLDVKLV